MNLYHDILLDYYRNPRHKGPLNNPDFSSDEYNPSCGDRILFYGTLQNHIIQQAAFDGSGCVISLATASMLAELAHGKTVAELYTWDVAFVINVIGIQLGPTRLKCALLPLQALHNGLQKYKNFNQCAV